MQIDRCLSGLPAPCGYTHSRYAETFAEFGRPRELRHAGGWILERSIPGATSTDAMGCYPIFSCRNWGGLSRDIENLEGLVSLSLVTDPFGKYDAPLLQRCFPDLTVPFKNHYATDLTRNPDDFLSQHHKRNIKKGLATVIVEECETPTKYGAEWLELYAHLTRRHSITGIAAFSPQSLLRQLDVPGLVMFRAMLSREIVGIVLWFIQNDIAYYHLAAYSESGYESRSSYAIFWMALQIFAGRGIRWLSLGSAAGLCDNQTSGLARFKQGWSTTTRTAYLCGRILNRSAYQQLVRDRGIPGGSYFPLYRLGEFS